MSSYYQQPPQYSRQYHPGSPYDYGQSPHSHYRQDHRQQNAQYSSNYRHHPPYHHSVKHHSYQHQHNHNTYAPSHTQHTLPLPQAYHSPRYQQSPHQPYHSPYSPQRLDHMTPRSSSPGSYSVDRLAPVGPHPTTMGPLPPLVNTHSPSPTHHPKLPLPPISHLGFPPSPPRHPPQPARASISHEDYAYPSPSPGSSARHSLPPFPNPVPPSSLQHRPSLPHNSRRGSPNALPSPEGTYPVSNMTSVPSRRHSSHFNGWSPASESLASPKRNYALFATQEDAHVSKVRREEEGRLSKLSPGITPPSSWFETGDIPSARSAKRRRSEQVLPKATGSTLHAPLRRSSQSSDSRHSASTERRGSGLEIVPIHGQSNAVMQTSSQASSPAALTSGPETQCATPKPPFEVVSGGIIPSSSKKLNQKGSSSTPVVPRESSATASKPSSSPTLIKERDSLPATGSAVESAQAKGKGVDRSMMKLNVPIKHSPHSSPQPEEIRPSIEEFSPIIPSREEVRASALRILRMPPITRPSVMTRRPLHRVPKDLMDQYHRTNRYLRGFSGEDELDKEEEEGVSIIYDKEYRRIIAWREQTPKVPPVYKVQKSGKFLSLGEAQALKLAAENGIPVPKVLDAVKSGNGYVHITMELINGYPLAAVLETAKEDWVAKIARQVKGLVNKIKQIPVPKDAMIMSLGGENEIRDARIFFNHHWPACKDEEGFNEFLLEETRTASPESREGLEESLRTDHAIQFTHGDLTPNNIMIDDKDNIVALLDWENSGWYPEWWEVAKFAREPRYKRWTWYRHVIFDKMYEHEVEAYQRLTTLQFYT